MHGKATDRYCCGSVGRLSGSERGRGTTEGMAEILWHRRETRRQTEKTNVSLRPWEAAVYSTEIFGPKALYSLYIRSSRND